MKRRCFISIGIPEEIKKEIVKVQNSLPDFYGKLTEPENLHLTLKFLGEISDDKIKEVRKKLGKIELGRFETAIDGIGVFSEKFVRIVWLHLTNCESLQKRIDEGLGNLFKPEKRFMSHLTIARIKNVKDKEFFLKKSKKIEIPKIRFEVGRFYLKESVLRREGPEYSVIEDYGLN